MEEAIPGIDIEWPSFIDDDNVGITSRSRKFQTFMANYLRGKTDVRILEAGCGSASNVDFPAGTHITGIDISQKQLDRNIVLSEKIWGDVQVHPLPTRAYDVVITWDVLEHLPEPERALQNFAQALRKDGILIVAVPNVYSVKGLLTKLTPYRLHVWFYVHFYNSPDAGRDDVAPFKTFLRRSISADALKLFAKQNGFEVAYYHPRDLVAKVFYSKHIILYGLYKLASWVLKLVTLGKAGPSDFILVLQKQ